MKPRYYYGHNIVAASFIIQAVSIGAMVTYGVFFKELQAEFGWSRSLVSGASSLAFLVMGAGGVLGGAFNDRVGPRILMTVSGVCLGLGYLLMSRLEISWQLYLFYGMFVGVGLSTHDVITLSTAARWFVIRRGMMSGIIKVGTGAGQLVVPLIAAGLISAFGWRSAYLIIGSAVLAALVAVAQVMKRDPGSMGLFPDGEPGQACQVEYCEDASLPLGAATHTIQFWILCIAEFVIFFCLLTTVVHIVPHALDQGLKPTVAAAILSTIGGVSMSGRFVMGMANDRIGGKRSLTICLAILITSLILLKTAVTTGHLFLFAVVYGFAHGGLFTVMSPTVAELFGTGSHGLLFGVILFCGTIGGSLGPLLTGYVFDTNGSYQMAFTVLAALALMGLCMILFLRPIGGKTEP